MPGASLKAVSLSVTQHFFVASGTKSRSINASLTFDQVNTSFSIFSLACCIDVSFATSMHVCSVADKVGVFSKGC